MLRWCPGPDSNRYGVASEGFSYSLQLSLPGNRRTVNPLVAGLESGLSLCRVSRAGLEPIAKVRQGPSSLYTFPRVEREGLARDCRHAATSAGEAVSPNLTPFTPAVSEPGAQNSFKSLASTNFATRAGRGVDCKPARGALLNWRS
jgi:hypothetical protein